MKNRTILPNIYLAIILLVMYIPIGMVILYSFNAGSTSSLWEGFSLGWYEELFRDRSIGNSLVYSIVLALCSSVLAAVIATLAAVGLPRIQLRGKGILEYISNMPIIIPEIILGMVFLSFFALFRFPFGMTTLVIAHTSFCIPYVYMNVKARLVGLDPSMVEAARDLGASELRAFVDVTLPSLFPAILSGMLLSFAMSMDDVVISIFVAGPTTNTLPLKIHTALKSGSISPKFNALCTLMFAASLLIVILAALVQRVGLNKGKAMRNKEEIKV